MQKIKIIECYQGKNFEEKAQELLNEGYRIHQTKINYINEIECKCFVYQAILIKEQ